MAGVIRSRTFESLQASGSVAGIFETRVLHQSAPLKRGSCWPRERCFKLPGKPTLGNDAPRATATACPRGTSAPWPKLLDKRVEAAFYCAAQTTWGAQ